MKVKNRFISSAGWEIGQQLYTTLVSLIIGAISARYLGPSNYGVLGVVSSMLLFLSAFSWIGMDSIFINEIVKGKNDEETIVGTVFWTRIITAVFLLPILILIVFFVFDDSVYIWTSLICGLSTVFQVYEVFHWRLQAHLETSKYAKVVIFVKTVTAIYQVYLLITRKNVFWFASIQVLQSGLMLLLLFYFYSGAEHRKLIPSFTRFKQLVPKSYHFMISAIALTLYMQIDKVMIAKMISDSSAGCYSVAVNISSIWLFIPMAFIDAARPLIFQKKEESNEQFLTALKRTIFCVSFLCFVIICLIALFAQPVILIMYGRDYLAAIPSLCITTIASGVAVVGVLRSIWILANGYNRYDKIFTISAAAINIFLNYFGIKYFGITGAAISTLVSYFFEVFVINLFFPDIRAFNKLFFKSFFEWRYASEWVVTLLKRKKKK